MSGVAINQVRSEDFSPQILEGLAFLTTNQLIRFVVRTLVLSGLQSGDLK